jgi:hypothetical protein
MTRKPAARDAALPASDGKRPYASPVLRTYGALSQLTQAKGMNGQSRDGAPAMNDKTK